MPFGAPWRDQPGLSMVQNNSNWEQRVIKEEIVTGHHDSITGDDGRQQVLPGGVPGSSPPKRDAKRDSLSRQNESLAEHTSSPRESLLSARPETALSDISCAPARTSCSPPVHPRRAETSLPAVQPNAAR